MLIQKLVDYHDNRIPITMPPMYGKMTIKWLIDLDAKGKFIEFVPTSSGKKKDKGKEYVCPHLAKTSGVRARLLVENGEYVIGKARKPKTTDVKKIAKDAKKVIERNQAFIKSIREAEEETKEATLKAVLRFYESYDVNSIALPKEFDPTQNLTFRVNGIIPFELPRIKAYWAVAAHASTSAKKGKLAASEKIMQCIVCGQLLPVVRRLPFKLKRLPSDGQMAEFTLISANSPAFESYGLEESYIAPICSADAEKFTKAANALLEGDDTHVTVGPLVYIFWTKVDTGFSFSMLLSKPDSAQVKQLITSVFKGKEAASALDESAFYAAAFSTSGSRAVVRDWLETTVNNAKQNLARYYRLQSIAELDGGEPQPMGINALSAATVPLKQNKPDYEKISPNVPKALLKCALEGKPLPEWLLYQAVKRTKAEQGVRKGHAALIKMVIASQNKNFDEEGNGMEELNKTNKEPAYLCGQLLGVLESVQYAAMGKTNSTVIGRFYGTASSAPASVFGTLLRGAQAHLDKLRKNKEGTYVALQRKLEDVQRDLTMFPKTLTLQQQGLFALGYYHLRAKDAKDRADAKAKKLANNTNENDTNE